MRTLFRRANGVYYLSYEVNGKRKWSSVTANYSAGTIRMSEHALTKFLSVVGDQSLITLTPKHIDQYKRERIKTLSQQWRQRPEFQNFVDRVKMLCGGFEPQMLKVVATTEQ
jgi:hypothetical protein